MPENWILRHAVVFLQDLALACTLMKPALFTITDFALVVVGLVTVLVMILKAH